MDSIRSYFYEELIKGYKTKFNTNIKKDGINVTEINNNLYGLRVDKNYIMINYYDEDLLFAYIFDSKNEEEIFTRYKLMLNKGQLTLIGSVFSQEENKQIVSSVGASFQAVEDSCLSDVLFFPEKFLTASPTGSVVKVLSKDNIKLKHFEETGRIICDNITPFKIINSNERALNEEIEKRRKK